MLSCKKPVLGKHRNKELVPWIAGRMLPLELRSRNANSLKVFCKGVDNERWQFFFLSLGEFVVFWINVGQGGFFECLILEGHKVL